LTMRCSGGAAHAASCAFMVSRPQQCTWLGGVHSSLRFPHEGKAAQLPHARAHSQAEAGSRVRALRAAASDRGDRACLHWHGDCTTATAAALSACCLRAQHQYCCMSTLGRGSLDLCRCLRCAACARRTPPRIADGQGRVQAGLPVAAVPAAGVRHCHSGPRHQHLSGIRHNFRALSLVQCITKMRRRSVLQAGGRSASRICDAIRRHAAAGNDSRESRDKAIMRHVVLSNVRACVFVLCCSVHSMRTGAALYVLIVPKVCKALADAELSLQGAHCGDVSVLCTVYCCNKPTP
jgi:hypothetical protein